jgi:NADH-quinone oxidoreductase subunit N
MDNVMLLMPEIFMALTAMGFLMVGVFQGNKSTDVLCWAACFSFIITGFLLLNADWSRALALNNMVVIDEFASFMKLIILIGLIASMALSTKYLMQEGIARFEYPVLIILSGLGMMLMVSSNNFLSLYMSLELSSLSLYVLAAFHRNSLRSAEAAAKYFILGALSSGMLLFGISLIYGFTGALDFNTVAKVIGAQEMIPPGFTVGMVFVLCAIAFKISAVPFHMWTPDVYQGAPTSVTAFFAIVPKIAAVGLLIRLVATPFGTADVQWVQILYCLSIASLMVGSFAALAQENIKRLMAYSSIGNMGYVLIGVIAASAHGVAAVMAFFIIYIFMTAGVFCVIMSMRREGIALERVSDLSGLSQNNPLLAYTMAALMFSMTGIPPLAGFFGKFFIFDAAVASGHYTLATIGILFSVVSAYYYMRIIKVMFFDEPVDPFDKGTSFDKRALLTIVMIFIVGFVLNPNLVLEVCTIVATALMP